MDRLDARLSVICDIEENLRGRAGRNVTLGLVGKIKYSTSAILTLSALSNKLPGLLEACQLSKANELSVCK